MVADAVGCWVVLDCCIWEWVLGGLLCFYVVDFSTFGGVGVDLMGWLLLLDCGGCFVACCL